MVALAVCSLPRLGRVVKPQLRKFFPVEIICRQSRTLVIPPAHHQAGTHTVEIGNTGQITFRTVAVVIAPTRYAPPQRTIWDTRNLGSRLTVENGQIFRPFENHTVRFSVVGVSAVIAHQYGLAFPVDRARSRFTGHFGLTVPVEVVNHELGVVAARPYVFPEIDTPQLRAVELVTVEIDFSRDSIKGIISKVRRVPFYDNFIFPVAINVSYTTTVW